MIPTHKYYVLSDATKFVYGEFFGCMCRPQNMVGMEFQPNSGSVLNFCEKKTETELGDNTKNNGKKEVSKLTRAQQKQEFVKLIKRLLAAYSIHSLCEARVRKCERGTSN